MFFFLATLSQLCSSMVVQCHFSSTLTLYIVDAVIPPYSKSKPGHHPTLLADDDGVTGAEANKSKVARLAKVSNLRMVSSVTNKQVRINRKLRSSDGLLNVHITRLILFLMS